MPQCTKRFPCDKKVTFRNRGYAGSPLARSLLFVLTVVLGIWVSLALARCPGSGTLPGLGTHGVLESFHSHKAHCDFW